MKLHRLFWTSLVLLTASATAAAANKDITLLGGSAMAFSPANVTINAGDTVTFHYAGGGLPHNVVADNGSFRCATSCSGSGANATSAAWNQVITFPNAGSFGYYCDIHGAPGGVGMAGKITVNAVTPPPSIKLGGYLSGNWFITNQSGHGFQLEFTNNNNDMLAIWFVYKPDGSGQNWIYSEGPYDPTTSTVTLPAEILDGAKFPPNFTSGDVKPQGGGLWGHLTFTFSDCNNGTVSWHSDLAGYNNLNDTPQPIQRLTQIAGTTCPAQ